jgi:hypothetical protein
MPDRFAVSSGSTDPKFGVRRLDAAFCDAAAMRSSIGLPEHDGMTRRLAVDVASNRCQPKRRQAAALQICYAINWHNPDETADAPQGRIHNADGNRNRQIAVLRFGTII